MLKFLKNILQLIINPEKGWEDISHAGEEPRVLISRGYFPLLIVAALTCVADFFKIGAPMTVIEVVKQIIETLTIYFASLYFAEFIFSLTIDKFTDKEPSTRKDTTFIVYCLSILVIISMIINLVPFDFPVLNFLPIYVGVIIYKGIRYLSVSEERQGHFMFMAVFAIIAPQYLIKLLFNLLLP